MADLTRFLNAQNQMNLQALDEVSRGRKETHWMWFIFPQLKGLGRSETANFYGIKDLEEAKAYLKHPVLGKHLIEITEALNRVQNKSAEDIFGSPDEMKLRSSLTLFANVQGSNKIFKQTLEKYCHGIDALTLQLLKEGNALFNKEI